MCMRQKIVQSAVNLLLTQENTAALAELLNCQSAIDSDSMAVSRRRGSSNRGPQDQAVSNSSSWKSNTERAANCEGRGGGEKDVGMNIEKKIDS